MKRENAILCKVCPVLQNNSQCRIFEHFVVSGAERLNRCQVTRQQITAFLLRVGAPKDIIATAITKPGRR